MTDKKKYKVLFLYEGVWREYKSPNKIKNEASELNLSNAKKVKQNLFLDQKVKSVKIVEADFEHDINWWNWFISIPIKDKIWKEIDNSENIFSDEFKRINFLKTNYKMNLNWQISFIFKNDLGDVICQYEYEKVSELSEEIKNNLDKKLLEIKKQTGRLFTLEIYPYLKKKNFIE